MTVLFVDTHGNGELREVESPGQLLPGLWVTERPFINKNIVVATSIDVAPDITTINPAVTYRRIYGPVVFLEGTPWTDITPATVEKILERFPRIVQKIIYIEEEEQCTETCASWLGRLIRGLASLLKGRR